MGRLRCTVIASVLALASGLFFGCQTSDTTTCGASVCPAGMTCVGAPDIRCVDPSRIEACFDDDGEPRADYEDCSFVGANEGGYCLHAICRARVCGNGVRDPGEICDDGNVVDGDECRGDCQSDYRCGNGIVDRIKGEVCDDGNSIVGDGCGLTCLSERCGDGHIDSVQGEECDDGNDIAGDGCGISCLEERCGNGFIDSIRGEVCDDGNLRSGDGCTSLCSNETSTWEQMVTILPGFDRTDSNLAFDSKRNKLVLFGGKTANDEFLDDTWEYDGSEWLRVSPIESPPARANHALAFDPVLQRIVLFGGVSDNGHLADTWVYNGATWRQISTTNPTPTARQDHRMVYDARQGGVFLHGGRNQNFQFDSWTFDGTEWELVDAGSIDTPQLVKFGLVYDPMVQDVLLFGGRERPIFGGPTPITDQLWKFDADGWQPIVDGSVPAPSARMSHGMVYDETRNRTIVFGGETSTGSSSNETWSYDSTAAGGGWTQIEDGPDSRKNPLMAFDGARGQVVMLGGTIATNVLPLAGIERDLEPLITWRNSVLLGGWDDLSLRNHAPLKRAGTMHCYDSARARLVMFGGFSDSTDFDEVWEYDGFQWRGGERNNAPTARSNGAMAFDSNSERCLLFGGSTRGGTLFGDTWTFSGTAWENISPTNSPAPRDGHAMAYDAGRDQFVLFGGVVDGSTDVAETWIFDGSTWTELLFAEGEQPSARRNAAMTYDPVRDRVILFGGNGSSTSEGVLGDTWEFDGSQWMHIPNSQHPLPRTKHGLSYIGSASSVLLHGGQIQNGSQLVSVNDTWQYVGTEWTPIPSVPPTDSLHNHLFSDSPSGPFVFSGARSGGGGTPEDEGWQHSFVSSLPLEDCTLGGSAGDVDGDGLIQCEDPDCIGAICGVNSLECIAGECVCPGQSSVELDCMDGVDNDCDGLVDCDDTDDCLTSTVCVSS